MSGLDATGVVLSYRRRENLSDILHSMASSGWIREIVVWNNDATSRLRLSSRVRGVPVRVEDSIANMYTLGRFLAAKTASFSHVATCDDDQLVLDWGPLKAEYDPLRVNAYLDAEHFGHGSRRKVGPGWLTMLGFGSLWPKAMLAAFGPYCGLFGGVDPILARKADRLFSLMQMAHPRILSGSGVVSPMRGQQDSNSLHLLPDHKKLNAEAASRFSKIADGMAAAGTMRRWIEMGRFGF